MGSALLGGLVQKKLLDPSEITISDTDQRRAREAAERFKVRIANDNKRATQTGDIIICAVKPNQIKDVLEEIAPYITKDHLFISIAAGITIAFLEKFLPQGTPIIRAMPNIPSLIGYGMTVIAFGKHVLENEKKEAEMLFGSVGRVITLREENLDAATGLSGCGPAYISVILEALADGGVKMGLSRGIAFELALQAMLGTAQLLKTTGEHPAVLKDRVASPGGSTISALHILEKGNLRGTLISAVEAATKRSMELNLS